MALQTWDRSWLGRRTPGTSMHACISSASACKRYKLPLPVPGSERRLSPIYTHTWVTIATVALPACVYLHAARGWGGCQPKDAVLGQIQLH